MFDWLDDLFKGLMFWFLVGIILGAFGVWKLIEILIWIYNHVRVGVV